MKINVNEVNSNYEFDIVGVSYIGQPKSNTVMFVTKKVEELLMNLFNVEYCLVFVESGIIIPNELYKKNCFYFSDSPQLKYAKFVKADVYFFAKNA